MSQRAVGLLQVLLRRSIGHPLAVEAGGQRLLGVTHHPDGDGAGVLDQGVAQVSDIASRQAQFGLDLRKGRPSAHPELPVSSVREEVVGVARGERGEPEHALVAGGLARLVKGRLQYEQGVRLPVGPQAGEIGECRVRPEGVIAVVGAHFQPAGRDDQPVAGECRRELGASLRGKGRDRGRFDLADCPRCPVLFDELPHFVSGHPGAVVCWRLFFAHPVIVPPWVPSRGSP